MGLKNLEIRLLITSINLEYKDIAEKVGVTPEYLSRCMRYQLKPKMQERIIKAINELKFGEKINEVTIPETINTMMTTMMNIELEPLREENKKLKTILRKIREICLNEEMTEE